MASAAGTVGARLTRNTLSMLGARIVMALAGLVSLPVVYQHLGPEAFGVWVLLTGLLAVVALFDLGLGSALVREVAAAETEAGPSDVLRRLLGLGLTWGLVLGGLTFAALAAGWPWIAHLLRLGELTRDAWHATLWLLLGVVAGGVELPWRAVLEGVQRYGALALVNAVTAVLGAVLTIAVVRLGGGLVALAAAAASTGAIRTILLAAAAYHRHRDLTPRWGRLAGPDLRRVGGYGLRVQVSSGAAAVNVELDRLVLGGFFGPAVAGDADLGTRLLNLLRLPPGFALLVLFPAAVRRAVTGGRAWLDTFYLTTVRYLAVFLAPAGAALMVSADPLVRLWLGHPVSWAGATIAILAPAYALNLIMGAATIVARVEGRPGLETRYVLLSVVLNVALTVPLLMLAGPLGVPTATALAVVLATGYFLAHFHRATGRPIRPVLRTLWPPIAAATVAGLATAALLGHLPDGPGRVGAALAVATRAGLTLTFAAALLVGGGYLSTDERARLRTLARRARALTPGVRR
ncbi:MULTISPECIES: lipopolysaccharide biosynthesis protein [unclassified Micromonospora]|uniref:lipopolysaccharide biosynthesis protein n=1 Tax=unclassified Micromonospora TaxID=2617518 RepID=UPI001590AC64|nr:oligosaccharide flippase family protein [Verrucosispora sp. NA02020]QKW15705.1 polysaccharide biosynthesis protein [Verrucosispora sp. NA02020]